MMFHPVKRRQKRSGKNCRVRVQPNLNRMGRWNRKRRQSGRRERDTNVET